MWSPRVMAFKEFNQGQSPCRSTMPGGRLVVEYSLHAGYNLQPGCKVKQHYHLPSAPHPLPWGDAPHFPSSEEHTVEDVDGASGELTPRCLDNPTGRPRSGCRAGFEPRTDSLSTYFGRNEPSKCLNSSCNIIVFHSFSLVDG